MSRSRVRGSGRRVALGTLLLGACVVAPVVADGAVPAGAAGGPGAITIAADMISAGATGQAVAFAYTVGTATSGTLNLTIPTGWTAPQLVKKKSTPLGDVTVTASSCAKAKVSAIKGPGPWTVPVSVNCAAGAGFTVNYSDATAQTAAGTAAFAAAFVSKKTSVSVPTSPSVTIVPGPAATIQLEGTASSVAPASLLTVATARYTGTFSSSYTALGFDQFGNPLGDVTDVTSFSISPDGTCEGATCTVDSTGIHTVSAVDGSATGQTSLSGDDSSVQMTCVGSNYDVNADVSDGCEQNQTDTATLQSLATSYGTVSDCDGNGHTVHFGGSLYSDARVHTSPAIPGFDSAVGSAPEWTSIYAAGSAFCTNDVVLTFSVAGSAHPLDCYRFTVITPTNTYSAITDSTGVATIDHNSNQYPDDSTLYIEVQKWCQAPTNDAVAYTVDGHI